MNNEIMETLKKADNESTEAPYWLILDPAQNMPCNVHELADQITGPFFCRQDAVRHLENRGYAFSERACVYCHSGHRSQKYKNLWREMRT